MSVTAGAETGLRMREELSGWPFKGSGGMFGEPQRAFCELQVSSRAEKWVVPLPLSPVKDASSAGSARSSHPPS